METQGTEGTRMVRTENELCINTYLGCYDLTNEVKHIIKSDNVSCVIWKKTGYMIWRANSLYRNMGRGMIER